MLKIDSFTVGEMCVVRMCAHIFLVAKATIVVDYSVADRLLPEPRGGSTLKERLQTTAKHYSKLGPRPSSSQP